MRYKKTIAGVVLLIVWIVSIYVGATKLQSQIDILVAQGNRLGDMAEEFLDARNEYRAKLTGCQDAKMEMFRMYMSCEEHVGELQREKKKP